MVNLPITCKECGQKHYYYGTCKTTCSPNLQEIFDGVCKEIGTTWRAASVQHNLWEAIVIAMRRVAASAPVSEPNSTATLKQAIEKLQCLHDSFSGYFTEERRVLECGIQMLLNMQQEKAQEKPKPIQFTICEGGSWLMWGAKVTPKIAHAIKFEDGSIFDMVNGWRK